MALYRKIGVALCIAAAAVLWAPAFAQEDLSKYYLELLRSDVGAQKIEILTEALDLNDQQAAAFWPIYHEYDAKLTRLGDRRVALVKRFAASYGRMTNEDAGTFAKDWFALQEERLTLREQYFKKIAKVTSNLVAARFVQVENTLGMLIDLQIAAEAPLMK